MRYSFANLVLEMIGAFVVWAIKGFKGKLSDEVSGPYETNFKSIRNAMISILVFIIIVVIISIYEHDKTIAPALFEYEIVK